MEREKTDVDVNTINLQMQKLLRTAEAQANFTRAKATAEARQITSDAQINATWALFDTAGITEQDHMMAFTYIRTLRDRDNLNIDVSYLAPETVVRTSAA